MAAHIAWLLNLDADLELQDSGGFPRARLSAQRIQELTARITDLVAPEDLMLDSARTAKVRTDTIIQAFCPTPSALTRIAELGLSVPAAPSFAVLRRVNDRAFCAELGHGLADSCFALDMPLLEEHLARFPATTFVLKRAFSFAGREQRRVRGDGKRHALDASTQGFCARSFERGEGLQVEPWVERLADFSRHGYITRAGVVLAGETREQQCDAMGRYIGVSSGPARVTQTEDDLLASTLLATGVALTRAGYFGPFGIDGFRYKTPDGGSALNPRCEVNARFTMGYPRALLLQGLVADEELARS
jgi:hypothetical protein